jgi:hypothetical protein
MSPGGASDGEWEKIIAGEKLIWSALVGPDTEQEKLQHRTSAHPNEEDKIRGSIKWEENQTGENEPQNQIAQTPTAPRSTSKTKGNKTEFSIKEQQDYNQSM